MLTTTRVDSRSKPSWAFHKIVSGEAVEHSRFLGAITVPDDEPILVDLVQRDEIHSSSDVPTITRGPVQVRIAGRRLSPEATYQLAKLLAGAVTTIGTARA